MPGPVSDMHDLAVPRFVKKIMVKYTEHKISLNRF